MIQYVGCTVAVSSVRPAFLNKKGILVLCKALSHVWLHFSSTFNQTFTVILLILHLLFIYLLVAMLLMIGNFQPLNIIQGTDASTRNIGESLTNQMISVPYGAQKCLEEKQPNK